MTLYDIALLAIVIGLVIFAIVLMGIQAGCYKHRSKINELTDPITGKFTKEGVFYKVKKLKKNKGNVTVIHFDLVNSHNVETKIGVEKYNELMNDIANYIESNIKEGSIIGHYDFDHFLICSYETDAAIIISFIENLQEYLSNNYNEYLRLEIIAGFAIDVPSQDTINKSISAWKYAKRNEENIVMYDERIYKIEEKFLQLLENPLALAKEFTVYYQPKVNATTGEIQGAEALARWVDDKGNVIMKPNEFIKEFENNGMIMNLDYYVFEEVCKLLESFKKRGEKEIVISLNFSRTNFNNVNLIEDLSNIMNRYDFNRKYLHIEVTESAYASNDDNITNCLLRLKELGIAAEMDDFGSGYSSVGSLVSLKCEVVKMDRLFVENNLKLKADNILIESLITMFEGVGLKVVVEGVETAYVVKQIRKIAPDILIQGFYFFKPMPLVKLERILMDSRYVLDDVFREQVSYKKNEVDYDLEAEIEKARLEEREKFAEEIEAFKASIDKAKAEADETRRIFEAEEEDKLKKMALDAENEKARLQEELDQAQAQLEEAKAENDALIEAQKAELEAIKASTVSAEDSSALNDELNKANNEIERLQEELDNALAKLEQLKEENNSLLEATNDDTKEEAELKKLVQVAKVERDQIQEELEEIKRQLKDLKYQEVPTNRYADSIVVVDETVEESDDDNNIEEQKSQIQKELDEIRALLNKTMEENEALRDEVQKAHDYANDEAARRLVAETEAERIADEKELLEQEALKKLLDDLEEKESNAEEVKEESVEEEFDDENDGLDDDLEDEMIDEIMEDYKKKYRSEWEAEMYKKYPELLKKQREKKLFNDKLNNLDQKQKENYNTLKNAIMKFGLKNRTTKYFDTFIDKTSIICKLGVVGKSIRLYLALNPDDYPEGQFPHKNVGGVKRHEKTPYLMKISSPLSVKRGLKLINDLMKLKQKEEVEGYTEKNYQKILQLNANRNK